MTTVLRVPTPIGSVCFDALTDAGAPAFEARVDARDAWQAGPLRLGLETIPFTPDLAPPLAVDGAVAIVARFDAEREAAPCGLRACIDAGAIAGGPAAGQHLVASTFRAHAGVISIGTPDEEYLAMLAAQGIGVPRRLADAWRGAAIRCVEGGLALDLPGLLAGEQLSLCIVIAWAADTPAGADATWFAVDAGVPMLTRWLGAG